MILRRRLLAAGACMPALTLPGFLHAQTKVFRVGWFSIVDAPDSPRLAAFMRGMAELGWVEGKHFVMVHRKGMEKPEPVERLDSLAKEFAQMNLDVMVAPGTPSVTAAQRAPNLPPVVFTQTSDPIALGIAKSYARPGGNFTGTSSMSTELTSKRMQLLKVAAPKISRLGQLISTEPSSRIAILLAEADKAAKQLRITLVPVRIDQGGSLEVAFKKMMEQKVDGLFVIPSVLALTRRAEIARLAQEHKLPAIYDSNLFTEAGGLMSYGSNNLALFHRAATYVSKILKGAKPGDIPLEMPTTFDFIVNMKAAAAIGIKFPGEIMLQATRVIE